MNGHNENERRREFEAQALVHADILYNSAVQMTRNVADAQDLVQETFVKAYRFFDTFKSGTNCKAWLFRIMRNTFINGFRKRSKRPAMVDFQDVEALLQAPARQEVPHVGQENFEVLFEQLVEDDIKAALDQLPPEFRMVTLLSDVEGFSYREIAEIMECPVGTVRSRLSRARLFLREKLSAFARSRGVIRDAREPVRPVPVWAHA